MNYLFFGLTYLASLGYLEGESDLEGWALYLVPLIPAWMVGAWWKFLFVMTLVIGGLYLWGASQGPS